MSPHYESTAETEAGEPGEKASFRIVLGFAACLIVLSLAAALLVADYADVVFHNSRRKAALALLKPGIRLTQAERRLNAAGYVTLYIDRTPPLLQVSTLSQMPMTATAFHRLFSNSAPDDWLRAHLSDSTRFYVSANPDGTVRFTPSGQADFYTGPTIPVGPANSPYSAGNP